MDGKEDEIQKITNNYSLKINMKKLGIALLVLFVGLFPCALIAQSENDLVNKAIDNGIGLGSVFAIVASWSRNKSILFGILHGLMGWLYVVYFVLTKEHKTYTNGDDTVTDEIYNDDVYKEQKN